MYYPLKLKKFTDKHINKKYVDEDLIKRLMKQNMKECSFNTFPYLFNNNSKQCLQKYKCGNCVSMSMNLKNMLKKHNIKSYLIPATIPDMYSSPDYLDISHVALIIFIDNEQAFLVDSSFYFLKPMKININNKNTEMIPWKNIYEHKDENINYRTNYIENDVLLNDYQIVPKNIYSVETYENEFDKWYYYIIEVMNPDKAISSFFLTSKKYPFLAKLDDNFNLKLYIKFTDKENFKININNENVYNGNIHNVPENLENVMKHELKSSMGNNYKQFFSLPHDTDKKIYNLKDNSSNKSITKHKKIKKKQKKGVKFNKTVKYI